MRYVKRVGPAGLAVAMSALFLGACVRYDGYYGAHRYGSLKDDPVVTGSTKRVAKVRVKRRAPMHRASATAVQRTSIASAEPAPYLKAPPPTIKKTSEPDAAPAEAKQKETIPAATPKPANGPEPPLPPVDDPAAVATMLSEGLALFDEGKVVQARRRFVAAMNGPVPDVLLALARSYDTYYLSRLSTADGAPDMQRALVLYERALERGAKDAAADLERTRGVLKIPR